jgi:putative transposase
MAWRVTKVEEQRQEFIQQVLIGDKTITDLCKEFQVSRKTGYKWVHRHAEHGEEGLKDRSRKPRFQAGKTQDNLVQKILEIKHKYPTWGPKKILASLEHLYPNEDWPSDTTVGNILTKNGLVKSRKLRKRLPSKTDPLSHCNEANDVWSIDFKGWFWTREGVKCDPLTISDAHTRFILYCHKLHSGKELDVWKVLEELFYKNGLPKYLRHDNGPPFATSGAGRLSRLSVKLIKAGVIPDWIAPGKPYQNGRHERMHRTLKREAIFPLQLTLEEQQMKFRDFIHYFNFERPHEALGQKCPGNLYVVSERRWEGKLYSPEYDNEYLVKRIRERGQLSWNGIDIYISKTLKNEFVGLKENDEGDWSVYFGPVFLGTINSSRNFITPMESYRPKNNYKVRCY